MAVAAFLDGTIRWYRADNGRELLAFFPHSDGKRWVLWTPSGYYDASVDGEDLIGWHVNNGPDREADFFSAWHFRDRFRNPKVVDLILDTLDEDESLRRAGVAKEVAQRAPEALREELPPVVTLLDPADGTEVETPTVKVRVNVRSPSGRPITRVRAKVDGRFVESRGTPEVELDPKAAVIPSSTLDFPQTLEIPLPPRDCTVEVVAEVGGRMGTSGPITLKRKIQAPVPARRLFALVVGISSYAKPEYKLRYADADARALAELLRKLKSPALQDVEVRELIDQQATRQGILEELEWLGQSVGPEDTALVFFAGHGVTDIEYSFLPYDADVARPITTLFPQSQLQAILTRLRGRTLLFLDTCRAGAVFGGSDDERRRRVDVTALLNSLAYGQSGLVVFSAATGRQLSQERPEWGHGAFTKALLEALGGKVRNAQGEITTLALAGFLNERVTELTQGAQSPVLTTPPGLPSLAILPAGKAAP